MNRTFTVLGWLLLSGAGFAQLPLPGGNQPVQPLPPRTAAVPSRQPGQEEWVPIQFPNSEVKEVLALYERLTKKHLVYDNQVIGNVNLVLSQPVPKEEAIKIIEINLLLNGFTLVPVEDPNKESTIIKVIGIGKNPRSSAIPMVADELLIPDGEHVITFLAKLKYADPAELAQILGTFVVPAPGQFTNITPLPKAGALLITENTAMIRQILRVIHEVDIPPAEVLSKFFELERGDAEDVQKKLEDILTKQQQQAGVAPGGGIRPPPAQRVATTPDGQPVPAGGGLEATSTTIEISAGGPNEENIIQGKIRITADKRTNRIHVVTRPVNMPFIEKLIREFDANVKFGNPTARPLKYVSASDVLQVVVKAISDPGAKEEGAAGAGGRPGQGQNRQQGAGGNLLGNNNRDNSFGGGNGGGGSGGGGLSVSEGLSTEPVDTTPDAVTVGNTRIIADKRANSIIVIGSEDVKQKLFKVIDELDKRAPQVMFHVVIGELNLNDKEQFGVDYIIRNAGLGISPIVLNPGTGTGGTDGTGTGTATPTTTGNQLVTFTGNQPNLNLPNLLNQNTVKQIATAGAGGLTGYFTAGNSLTAIVTALESTNRFRVVSRPSVFTSNLKKAIIASGQEIAVPTTIQSSVNAVTAGNAGLVTNSSVQYKNVTLQLEVVPLINADREVDLDILQKNDEVAGSTRIDNNDIPTIATRYVRTHVTVPDQATLVLGGLIKSSTNRVRSGIPLLSSIPVLGYLFSNTTKERIRQELVILIRPEVSWTPQEAIATREHHQEFFNLPPDLESTAYPTVTKSRSAPDVEVRRATAVERTTRVETTVRKKK
ncbi:MAG: ral secretion pathway protein [Chthoniobacter sp.]|jgi:type II secretion system protein D|nr:ral secretion pathway protein [Chthoniobacter sp.]